MLQRDLDDGGLRPQQAEFLSDPEDIHRATGLPSGGVPGFVFLCNNDTQRYCFQRRTMTMGKKSYSEMVRRIGADTRLFLLNIWENQLYGPFAPATRPLYDVALGKHIGFDVAVYEDVTLGAGAVFGEAA